jgi:hypothetical protein
MSAFAYIGRALSGQEFIDYVATYDFGSVPPSFVVCHNSANPDASWAKFNNDPNIKWDRNEAGLSSDAIKAKRKPQLDNIKNYYVGLGWSSGPHLFIDERWIWLFTPLYEVGTHAKSGNSYRDASGALHYSIGIETVGWFGNSGWPESMQKLLQIAVQSLRDRLKTFTIIYTSAPTNRPDLHDHQVSFHRDYNKPECPGAVITPDYAIPILSKPYQTVYTHYKAGPFGAIAQQDRRADAPGAKVYMPGEPFESDDLTNDYLHDRTGIGFVPLGQTVKG